MAEDREYGAAAADSAFAAKTLRIRTEAQKALASRALERLTAIAMGEPGSTAVQVSALRELLDQTLGRPYAPALPNQPQDTHAIIEGSGAEFRAQLDRMDEAESSGPAAPDDQSRTR